MSKKQILVTAVVLMVCGFSLKEVRMAPELFAQTESQAMNLPAVERKKTGSFSDLMYQRSSVRSFSRGTISLEQVSKILFAAQGITRGGHYRTVPSAGALCPLEVYLAAGQVQGLDPGVYKYRPKGHRLEPIAKNDRRRELAQEAYGQTWIAKGQAILVICAVYERVTAKYGERGRRYVHIEAGCAAQNVSLEGFNIGLGSTVVGAFSDDGVAGVIEAEDREKPLVVMPVGLLP